MYKLCPYCQQQVPVYQWAEHEMRHRAASPPFQPTGHVHAGFAAVDPALAKHPRMYHHPRCGRSSALPEAVIAAQSRDPFSSTDYAPCSGCGRYVHTSELFFEGTNESLLAADRRRKADFIRQHGLDPGQFIWDATGPVRRKSSVSWGLVIGLGVGGLALVFFLCIPIGLILLMASRAAARRPPQPVPMQRANHPFPVQDLRGLPNSLRDDLERSRQRHDELMQELHRQNERLLEDLRRVPKVEPPDIPVGPLGPAGEAGDPAADARRQIDELRRKSQERMDQQRNELRERSRQRQEEMRKRMDDLRQRFP